MLKPFLKWAGGKQQLLAQYAPRFPTSFNNYVEAFLGSGAVFFHLCSARPFAGRALLCDSNPELILTYAVVRDQVDALIDALRAHAAQHSPAHYAHVRSLDRQPDALAPVARAARMIYLNKTCFNGLYRVNRSGQFNVPMGRYKHPPIVQEPILRAASAALHGVELHVGDFAASMERAAAGDFVYLDPPYAPLSRTANFTSYTAGAFDAAAQQRLADAFRRLDARGCLLMLSNSDTPLIRDLYAGFCMDTVRANRAINAKTDARGAVAEVLVRNYGR